MANLVITSTATAIAVEFNDMASTAGLIRGKWPRAHILSIGLHYSANIVEVVTRSGEKWIVSHTTTNGALIVDSVDGVAPVDTANLYTLIAALIP